MMEAMFFARTPNFVRFAVSAAMSCAACTAAPAKAQTIAPDQRIDFDIPAQPLDAALTAYFRGTGVQLLYDSRITADRRSSPIKGRYAPRAALALLLRGTGLVARYSGASAAVITTPERSGEPTAVPLGRVVVRERIQAARPSMIDRLGYYGALEQTLESYLHQDPRTRRLTFTLSISLKVTDAGRLSEVKIYRSSGDGRKDRLVLDTLLGRTVTGPPDGIPQPLLIALRGHRADH